MSSVRVSREELVETLRLSSPALVEEVLRAVLRQVDAEDRREGVLTGKALAVLGQTALVTTVAGGFVGFARETLRAAELHLAWRAIAGGAALVLLVLALIAAVNAIRVVLVRSDFREPSESVLFNREELRSADSLYANTKTESRERDLQAVTQYRRWLVPHLWSIYQRHNEIHHSKATCLAISQRAFAWFVAGVSMALPVVLYSALLLQPSKVSGNCETKVSESTTAVPEEAQPRGRAPEPGVALKSRESSPSTDLDGGAN